MTLPFLATCKSLCGADVGINMKTYLHCIYCKVKTRIWGEKCHTLILGCACVWNIYGGYPNYTMLLKTCLSCLKLGKLLLESMGYLSSFFFLWRASEYLLFSYLGHLSIFFNTFSFYFINNFCISHASCFYNWKLSRETSIKTWSIYSNKHILVSIPSVGVEHFWWMEDILLHTPSVRAADICELYVILISGAWQVPQQGSQGLTKLKTNTSSICRRWWGHHFFTYTQWSTTGHSRSNH
jgi:hypothetical protein